MSLVPSVTETLLAWGVRPAAVTRFCEQPELPAVGGTKNPDVAAIVALHPDLVVVDREENRLEDAMALRAAGVAVLALHVTDLAGVEPALDELAAAVGYRRPVDRPGSEVIEGPPAGDVGVFVPIWRRPWMTINAATYGSTLLAAAGASNVFAEAAARYPEIDLDEAVRRRPRVVLAPSEPYPFGERHRAELERVAPVVLVDGKDLFWWGARTPGALRRLTERMAAGFDGPDGRRQGFR